MPVWNGGPTVLDLRWDVDEEEVKVILAPRKIPISALWQTLSKRAQLHDHSDAQLSQVVGGARTVPPGSPRPVRLPVDTDCVGEGVPNYSFLQR